MESVLVIDDDEVLRSVVRSWIDMLGFRGREAGNPDDALQALDREPAEIVVCDADLAGRRGLWLAARIRDRFPHTAIVMATAAREVETAVAALRNDAVDYLLKPFDRTRLSEALALGREFHAASAGLDQLQHALQDRLRQRRVALAAALSEAQATRQDALEGLIAMLQLHARDGRGHATRVARIAMAIADELGLDDEAVETLEHGALLHDIGKLEVPASILSKPAPLNEREWQVMRTHPQVGYNLLQSQPRFADAAEIVLAHHEAYDGSGYPRGIGQDEIPLGARILAVADAYDSMTQPHTQRPPMSPALAVQEIERCRGQQFDPRCAEALGPVLAHAVEENLA